jgi:hypothetical protein
MASFRKVLCGCAVTGALITPGDARSQAVYQTFEFQLGVQIPTTSMVRSDVALVQRDPGGTIGFVFYSTRDDPVGIRLRGDFAFSKMHTTVGEFRASELLKEFFAGADVVPRKLRLAVRGIEARFYAGAAFHVILASRDEVTVDNEFTRIYRTLPTGATFGVVGRAGWFMRRTTRVAPLRLDLAYQIGDVSGYIQHDLVFRIGVGNQP